MKRLTVLVLLLAIVGMSTGCKCGRLFRRGAKCGIPSFKMPRLRKLTNACQNGGCNIQPNVPVQQGFPLQNGVTIDSAPSTGFQTAPIDGSTLPADANISYSPIYTQKPMVVSEGVVGPEFGSTPSAP